jgi:hypothetical protein
MSNEPKAKRNGYLKEQRKMGDERREIKNGRSMTCFKVYSF